MAIRYWEGGVVLVTYQNGTHEPVVGEVLTGQVSLATGQVVAYDNAGGWAGAGTGNIWLNNILVSTFSSGEELRDPSSNDVADTTAAQASKTGDWQTPANWSADTIPVNDDFIIFDSRGGRYDETIYDVTEGTLVGETGGVTPDLMHVKKGYTGDIALITEPLHLLPDKLIYEGSGTCYFEASQADAVSDGFVGTVICNTTSGTLKLDSNVNSASWVQGFTVVQMVRGTLDIGENLPTWIITLNTMTNNETNASGTITIGIDCERIKATTAQTTIVMGSGTLTTDSDIGTFYFLGGTTTIGTDLGASPEVGHEIASLFMHRGTLNWNPDATGTVIITLGQIYGGTIEASGATNANRAKALGTVEVYAGATLNLNNGRGNITITSQLINHGGSIIFDTNSDISVAYDTI